LDLGEALYSVSRSAGTERENRMLQDHSIAQETGMNEYWPGLLDEHDVQFLVLDRHSDSDLLNLFRSQPGWAVDFEDEEAVIFVRADIARMHNSRARTHDDAWVAA